MEKVNTIFNNLGLVEVENEVSKSLAQVLEIINEQVVYIHEGEKRVIREDVLRMSNPDFEVGDIVKIDDFVMNGYDTFEYAKMNYLYS